MRFNPALFIGVAAAALLASGAAQAADFMNGGGGLDPIYDSPLFNFEGFYTGATVGAAIVPGPGTVGTIGVVAGANFEVVDGVLAGLEFQGDALWNGTGFVGINALALAKVGSYLADDMVVYGTGGGGWVNGVGSYAIGAGIEWAVAEQISVRGEGLATGTWGVWPNGGKATVGVLWHLN